MYSSLNRTVIFLCDYRAYIKKLQGLIKQNRAYLGKIDKVVLKLIPEQMIGVDDYQQYLNHTNEQNDHFWYNKTWNWSADTTLLWGIPRFRELSFWEILIQEKFRGCVGLWNCMTVTSKEPNTNFWWAQNLWENCK